MATSTAVTIRIRMGSSRFIYLASRRTIGSIASGAGNSRVSRTRRRSGSSNTRKSANKLLATGRVPHISPSVAVGMKPTNSSVFAGGTSSLVHSVTLPLS